MRHKDDLINLSEYAAIIRRSWLAIVLLTGAGFLIALAITGQRPTIYESEVEMVAETPQGNVAGVDVYPFSDRDSTFVHTQINVLKSEFVTSRAVGLIADRISNVKDGPIAENGSRSEEKPEADIRDHMRFPFFKDKETDQDALQRLRKYIRETETSRLQGEINANMRVGTVPKTRILKVKIGSRSPEFSAAAGNAIAQAYSEYISHMFASTAERNFQMLKKQATEASEDVKEAAEAVRRFKRKTELETMSKGLADKETTGKQIAYEDVVEKLALENPEIVKLEDELTKIELEISQLKTKYKAKHPELRKRISTQDYLKQKIARLKKQAYAGWEREYLAERNEVEFSMLKQDLDATRRIHETIVGKMKEIDLSKEPTELSVQVLKQAEIPDLPAYPNKPANLFLGSIAGLLIGVLMGFVRARASADLVSAGIEEEELPAPLLGSYLHVKRRDALDSLVHGEDKGSPAAEALKSLRTAVERIIQKAENNVVLVTSPQRGDGKTTVTSTLARSFADLGYKVLLIDGDLRRGELHNVFDIDTEKGLSEILCGSKDVSPVGLSETLWFLSHGTRTKNPAELLSSDRLEQVIDLLQEQYDIIFIDSPPLLAVTDASLLARCSGATFMVVRSDSTHLQACQYAARVLLNLGYRIEGVILNDLRQDSGGYGYYPRYQYGYGSEKDQRRQRK